MKNRNEQKSSKSTYGNTKFINSITKAILIWRSGELDLDGAFKTLKSTFPNLDTLNLELEYEKYLSVKEMYELLSKPYLKCISKLHFKMNSFRWINKSIKVHCAYKNLYRLSDEYLKIGWFQQPFKIQKTKLFRTTDLDELFKFEDDDTMDLIKENGISVTDNCMYVDGDIFPIPKDQVGINVNDRDLDKVHKSIMSYMLTLPTNVYYKLNLLKIGMPISSILSKIFTCALTEAKGKIHLVFYLIFFDVFYKVFKTLTRINLKNIKTIEVMMIKTFSEDLSNIVKRTHGYIHWKLHILVNKDTDSIIKYKPLANLKNVRLYWNLQPNQKLNDKISPMFGYLDVQQL